MKYIVKFSCLSYLKKYFFEACTFSTFHFFQFDFDVLWTINNFFDWSISYLKIVPEQILEMFFRPLNTFFLDGNFNLCSRGVFLSAAFNIYHGNSNIFSTEYLILLIWPRMHSTCSFWYLIVTSQWDFLHPCAFAFVRIHILKKDVFFLAYLVFKSLQLTPREIYISLLI